jgi:hypothetical protein
MRRTITAAAFALLLAVRVASAQEKDEARAVVEKAIAAHGGMERLAKNRADWVTVKGVLLTGGKARPFTAETVVQLPGQFKSVLSVTVDDQKSTVVQVISGDTTWTTLDDAPQKITPSALNEMKAIMHLNHILRLAPLLNDKSFKLAWLGEAKVDGRETVSVKVMAKGQREVRLYFDKEKGFLTKTEHLLDDSRGKEVKQEEFYSEFKDFAGFKRPSKLMVSRDGKKTMEAELVEVKYYEKIEEAVFAKP